MDRFFDLPLNLPHAATVSVRVFQRIQELSAESDSMALISARELAEEIGRYRVLGDPDAAEGMVAQADAIERARKIVRHIRLEELGSDRLGHAVRNLFECLGYGKEGAEAGLVAGENPDSLQRP